MGSLFPPLDYHTMLEYSHRLSATVVGILVVIALYLAWRHFRENRPTMISTSAGAILVIAAVILGGLTVLSELTWWVRLIHLGLAELVVASMAVAWLSSGAVGEGSSPEAIERPRVRFDRLLMWGTLGGVMIMILYGSYIVGAGYGSSCGSWPMCQGWGIPDGVAFQAHMGHRYLAVIVFALVAGMGHVAWRRGAVDGEIRWLTVLTGAFLVAEVLVGAFTVWLGFAAAVKSLHLTVATLMWASTVLLAAVYLRPDLFRVPNWHVESMDS